MALPLADRLYRKCADIFFRLARYVLTSTGFPVMTTALSHKYLHPSVLCKFVGALVIGATMGLAVEASDYNYGTRQIQSWDKQNSSDYATRWDRGTKPWSRTSSGPEQPGFGSWGNGASTSYDSQRTRNVNPEAQRSWQTEQDISYSDNAWYTGNERDNESYRVPAREEQRAKIRQRKEQSATPDEQRNPWAEVENQHKSEPWTNHQPSSQHWNDRRSADTSWSQGSKGGDSPNTYGDNKSWWRDRSQPSAPGSFNDYSSSGYGSEAAKNPWINDPRANDPWRGSEPHTSVPDPSRHREHWVRGGELPGQNDPWGTRRYTGNSQNKQRSYPTGSTQNLPPADVMRPGYSEYPAYSGYPEFYAPYSGMGENGPGYGYYPGYNPGWSGDSYTNPGGFPLFNNSLWSFF